MFINKILLFKQFDVAVFNTVRLCDFSGPSLMLFTNFKIEFR